MIPDKKKLINNENDFHYNEFKNIMKNNNFNFIDVLPYFKGHNNLFFKRYTSYRKRARSFE